jgi:hypothetical protein
VGITHFASALAVDDMTENSTLCPRCEGQKVIIVGPVVEGMAMTGTCPRCKGEGSIKVETKRSHWNPEMKK